MDNSNNLPNNINLQVDVIDNQYIVDMADVAESAIDLIRNLLNTTINEMPNVIDSTPFTNLFHENILSRSFTEDQPKYKHILSDNGDKTIEYIPFSPDVFKNQKTCVITRMTFENEDVVAKLPCGHIFDKDAILKWLKQEKASCPVCRFKLDSKEEKVKDEESHDEPVQLARHVLNMMNYINYEQDEENLQRAILESIKDMSGN